ncbi:glycoside hydrolase family 65 protein [Phenylobacterium sp. J367]|uniref:glycoside hydrolase family 65 protein n=1 Tax=Phenylobacterium sp. J367 TaxID=2898435 RepID=UPI0021517F16|nr:glycoside hydrolase family 65 protein [Phenylobacterium sp. J367]MCR5880817.1 glycoside hydrolase family 65 protein [Phenylobacterium sp. J367]
MSNGLVGLRVRENPLAAGMAILSGFSGRHPERRVEAAAPGPYPLAGDIAVDGVWLSDEPGGVEPVDQAYDFETAELTSRLAFRAEAATIRIEVVTFASRSHPWMVCQETRVEADAACELQFQARIDPDGVRGRGDGPPVRHAGRGRHGGRRGHAVGLPGRASTCGIALAAEAPAEAVKDQNRRDVGGPLAVTWRLRLRAGRSVRFRQLVSQVASVQHAEPDAQAVRLLSAALEIGFDGLRRRNREAWADLWRSRIRLVGADETWQALADAAFFYLNSSTHPASPASTSIFGLATWHDYHYYFGHVMWDIDAFAVPVLSLLQPPAAAALLEFRSRHLGAVRENARMVGLPGLKFPWEAAPSNGQEATPGPGSGATREDHVSLHVARAFAFHADVTGDARFAADRAWPVLSGVADWICARVTPNTDGGFDWREVGGAAERKERVDNDTLTNLLARSVLARALGLAERLGRPAGASWRAVRDGLAVPMRSDGALAGHDGHRFDEEQGAAPTPPMALFPYWADVDPTVAAKTLRLYLDRWEDYVGAPMLAAFYPAWAAWLGDRDLALKLMQEGYGAYQAGRFAQTLEYRLDKVDGPAAGPFFANMGAFLLTLLLGLCGVRPDEGPPASWPQRPVVLPQGWTTIECDRLIVHGRAARLRAVHGADRAELSFFA